MWKEDGPPPVWKPPGLAGCGVVSQLFTKRVVTGSFYQHRWQQMRHRQSSASINQEIHAAAIRWEERFRFSKRSHSPIIEAESSVIHRGCRYRRRRGQGQETRIQWKKEVDHEGAINYQTDFWWLPKRQLLPLRQGSPRSDRWKPLSEGQNCGTDEIQDTALEEGVVRYLDENPCLKDRTVAQVRSKIQHLKRGSSDT